MSLLLDLFGFEEQAHDCKQGLNPALFPSPWSASAHPTQILKPDLSILMSPLHPGKMKSIPNTKPRTLLFPLGNVRDGVTKQQLAKICCGSRALCKPNQENPQNRPTKGPRPSRLVEEKFFIDQSLSQQKTM